MLNRENIYKWSQNRTALLVAQIFALLVCLGYFDYIYYFNIYPDKQVKEAFVETECFVITKNLGSKNTFFHKYRANFYITYSFNGAQYNRWVSGNGLDMSYYGNRVEQENILSRFNQGSSYQCWVNPENPEESAIVLRHHWMSTTPLILPSVIMVIVSYYLFKNVSFMLATRREKKREKRNR